MKTVFVKTQSSFNYHSSQSVRIRDSSYQILNYDGDKPMRTRVVGVRGLVDGGRGFTIDVETIRQSATCPLAGSSAGRV